MSIGWFAVCEVNMNYMDIRQSIINITTKGKPIIDISDLLFEHKCYYLMNLCPLTQEQKTKLNMILAVNDVNNKIKYSFLHNIFNALANVNYAVIKGAVLSDAAYRQPNMRKSLDVDFLIHPSCIKQIKDILLANGFIQGHTKGNKIIPYQRKETVFYTSSSHQLAPFIAPTGNQICPFVSVDLNFNIVWGESRQQIDMDFVLSELQEDIIYGQTIKKLSCEMEFIHLCLHHYKDLNSIYLISRGSIKLNLFSDIFFYIVYNDLDIQKMLYITEKLKISKYIFYCLFYCGEIFTHTKLDELISAYKFSADFELICSFGLHELERKKWNFSFYDRLFKENFPKIFIENLSNDEKEKIEKNYEFLGSN